MDEKQNIIKEMLTMQHKIIELEQGGKFDLEDYYDTGGDSEIATIKSKFNDLSIRLVDLAHAEKGSHR